MANAKSVETNNSIAGLNSNNIRNTRHIKILVTVSIGLVNVNVKLSLNADIIGILNLLITKNKNGVTIVIKIRRPMNIPFNTGLFITIEKNLILE